MFPDRPLGTIIAYFTRKFQSSPYGDFTMKHRIERGSLVLHNTMSGKNEVFRPRHKSHLKLFTCGPSVYRLPHLGNYRTFFFEDILQRYLEHISFRVDRVINYTDIEDKSLDEAKRTGTSVTKITEPVEAQFTSDCEYLSIRLPEFIPRSSTSVETSVSIIQKLLDQGNAYRYDDDIYFDPLTFEGFGKLFGLDMRKWPKEKRRFSKDTYPGQRWNLGDFILWHGYHDGDQVYWNTALGKGRPAWNVQDPAMIVKHLGTDLDICCGGIDNLYRHHDYTIAVVEAFSGEQLAPYWLHGRHLLVDGHKMSKKKGNVLYPKDLREKGYSGAVLRYFFASRHYRKKLNFTFDALDTAENRHQELVAFSRIFTAGTKAREDAARTSAPATELLSRFEEACNDDLHIDKALKHLERDLFALAEAQREGKLSESDVSGISHVLQQIDQVIAIGL